MDNKQRQAYQQIISATYDARSANHDNSDWHRDTALRLVEELPVSSGDHVLDVACGTGTIAFHTAEQVGPEGRVVGIDLSEGMLAQANEKLSVSGLNNLVFILADAEHLNFPANSFERIYCASAFFWMLDPLATLKHWRDLLKPGGEIGFHALPDTSYVWVSEAQRILENYGISYTLNKPTGTLGKCRKLLEEAGFRKIDIRKEELGRYIPLEQAKNAWLKMDDFSPGQHPNPLQGVAPEIVARAQHDYEARIEALNTDKGVWNDRSMFYVYGQK